MLVHSTESSKENCTEGSEFFVVPRGRALIFDKTGKLRVSSENVLHGEAETRFIAAFHTYIHPAMPTYLYPQPRQAGPVASPIPAAETVTGSLILSNDTDVFLILLCNPSVHNYGFIHVLNDTVHSVDEATYRIGKKGCSGPTVSMAYAMAGCDFNPSFHGIGHEVFPYALCGNSKYVGALHSADPFARNLETFICIVFLRKLGIRIMCNLEEGTERIREEFKAATHNAAAVKAAKQLKDVMFISNTNIGSEEWKQDVRNFVADKATCANQLITPLQHIVLHGRRAWFIVNQYWGQAQSVDFSPHVVGGLGAEFGYTDDGNVLLEEDEGICAVQKEIAAVVISCKCKGECKTRRCSCRKAEHKCVGCQCSELLCHNKIVPDGNSTGEQGMTITYADPDTGSDNNGNVTPQWDVVTVDEDEEESDEGEDAHPSSGTESVSSDRDIDEELAEVMPLI